MAIPLFAVGSSPFARQNALDIGPQGLGKTAKMREQRRQQDNQFPIAPYRYGEYSRRVLWRKATSGTG